MKRVIACFLAVLLLMPLTACRSEGGERYTSYTLDCFDTVTTLVGYADSEEEFEAVKEIVFSTLRYYHGLFSIYDTVEGVNNLKTLNEVRSMTCDKALVEFLVYAKEMHEKTGGRMNIAMGSVLSLWHTAREAGLLHPESASLPDRAKLEEAAKHCDIASLVIDEESLTVRLTDDGCLLDVGALGKGYAVEMAARALEKAGITGYIINAGGNVRTVGTRADGSLWKVGVEDPDNEGYYLDTLSIRDASLVTSGSYMRYYYVKGQKYHHIISPDTLMPSEYFTSLTVLCRDSALADALSTALFTLSYEDGLLLLKAFPEVEVLWLFSDGEVKKTAGWDGFGD